MVVDVVAAALDYCGYNMLQPFVVTTIHRSTTPLGAPWDRFNFAACGASEVAGAHHGYPMEIPWGSLWNHGGTWRMEPYVGSVGAQAYLV